MREIMSHNTVFAFSVDVLIFELCLSSSGVVRHDFEGRLPLPALIVIQHKIWVY
jgi:hypothetical protein